MTPHDTSSPSGSSVGSLTNYQYEFVPLLELPQVDFAVSLVSRFHNRKLERFMWRISRSPLTFVGFLVFLAVSILVQVVPASIGRGLAVLGVCAGLPGAVSLIATLRYEMVIVLLQTYDVWFFVITSITGAGMLAMIFNDTRGLVTLVSWPSYLVNIFVDANLVGLRNVWIGNLFAVVIYLSISACISTTVTPEIQAFDVMRINSYSLPAAALLRDCQLTMTVGILRNLARRAHRVVRRDDRTASRTNSMDYTTNCVSFRCRLQLRPLGYQSQTNPRGRIHTGGAVQAFEQARTTGATTHDPPARSQLKFTAVGAPIDIRNTVLRVSHSKLLSGSTAGGREGSCCVNWTRAALKTVVVVGFVIVNLANVTISLAPLLADYSILLHSQTIFRSAAFGFASALGFSIMCLAACQRQLLYALATSFDFVFTAGQATLLHLTLMEMCRWMPTTTLSLSSSLLWSLWLLYWDALTPVVRTSLGLSSRLAAWVGIALMATLLVNGVLIFVVLHPTSLRDRAIASIRIFGREVEFRTVSWFFSSSMTIATSASRLIWRLWHAKEHELVVLDGQVTYERRARLRGVCVVPSVDQPSTTLVPVARGRTSAVD